MIMVYIYYFCLLVTFTEILPVSFLRFLPLRQEILKARPLLCNIVPTIDGRSSIWVLAAYVGDPGGVPIFSIACCRHFGRKLVDERSPSFYTLMCEKKEPTLSHNRLSLCYMTSAPYRLSFKSRLLSF